MNVSKVIFVLDIGLEDAEQAERELFAESVNELLEKYGLIKERTTLDHLIEAVGKKVVDNIIVESEKTQNNDEEWVSTKEAAELSGKVASTILDRIHKNKVTCKKVNGNWFILKSDALKIKDEKASSKKKKKRNKRYTAASPVEAERRREMILSIVADNQKHSVTNVAAILEEVCDFSNNRDPIDTVITSYIIPMVKDKILDWEDTGSNNKHPGRHDIIFLQKNDNKMQTIPTNGNGMWPRLFSQNS